MSKPANPQGKGLTPLLDTLQQSRSQLSVPAKQIDQISHELFTSLFILHSHFSFKPVRGKTYWLYRKNQQFRLSMIAPAEGGSACLGQYIGECSLQSDVTWTLMLCKEAASDAGLIQFIENRRQVFNRQLSQVARLEQALPTYVNTLPFYQRVFASALANSIKNSMVKSGIQALSYQQAIEKQGQYLSAPTA